MRGNFGARNAECFVRREPNEARVHIGAVLQSHLLGARGLSTDDAPSGVLTTGAERARPQPELQFYGGRPAAARTDAAAQAHDHRIAGEDDARLYTDAARHVGRRDA